MATTKTLEGPIIQLATGTQKYLVGSSWREHEVGLYLTYIIEDQYMGTTTIKYSLFEAPYRVDGLDYWDFAVGDPIHLASGDLPAAISYWYTNPVTENTFRKQIEPWPGDISAIVTEVLDGGSSVNCRRWLLEDIVLMVNETESYNLNVTLTNWFYKDVNATVTIGLADYAVFTMAPAAFTDEASPTVQYINPKGNAVSYLQVGIARADTDELLVPFRSVNRTTSGSYTFQFTQAELSAFYSFLATTTNGRIYFALRTSINGVVNIASSYATLSLVNHTPIIAPTVLDTNETTIALTGDNTKFVKYYSTARFVINATAFKGASIASYYTTHNNAIYRGATGTVNNVEHTKFDLSATDTRNLTASETVNISMIDYIKLTCNLSAELPTTDDRIKITITGNYWNGNFGAQENTLRLQYRYKTNTNETYSNWATASADASPAEGNVYSNSYNISVPNHVDRYTIQVRAIDKLATVESKTVTVQAYPLFDWSDSDFHFNLPVNIDGNLSVAGNIYQNGSPMADFIVEQGTKTTGSGNSQANWVYRKWNSGIAECWCRKHVSTAVNTAWGNLYVSGALSYTNITWGVSFTDIPVANITIAPNNSGAFLIAGGSTSLTATNTGGYEIARGSALASAGNFYINYYAIGKWK